MSVQNQTPQVCDESERSKLAHMCNEANDQTNRATQQEYISTLITTIITQPNLSITAAPHKRQSARAK